MPSVKSSIVPPGGFHYTETHGGSTVELTGDSVDTLAAVIGQYRANNGFPAGNPRQEVVDFICGHWPHFCNEVDENFLTPQAQSPEAPLSKRVAAWVTRLWNLGAGNFVRPEEAAGRAAICAACPLNRDFRAGGCPSCVDAADRLVFLWRTGRETPAPHWHALKACLADGAHLQGAVFAAQLPAVTAAETATMPPACWRKLSAAPG